MNSRVRRRTVIGMLSTKAKIRLSKGESRMEDCRWSGNSIVFIFGASRGAQMMFWTVCSRANTLGSSQRSLPALCGLSKNLGSMALTIRNVLASSQPWQERAGETHPALSVLAQRWPMSLLATACWREINCSTLYVFFHKGEN